ncbi:hypothetical protein D1871_12875 [Nakamurella silvestris]|nr:hypothetical protein D1871_12875 [Nakamurella silvestris]
MTQTTTEPRPPSTPAQRARGLLQPGWIAVILLAVLFAGACWAILAPWQFHRNTERQERNNAITSAVTTPAVPVTDLLSTTVEPDASVAWKLVTATGTFSPDDQVFVRLRQLNGRPAFEVLVPLVLSDGTRLLVDRGYVSAGVATAGLDLPPLPTGVVTITGRTQQEQPYPTPREPVQNEGRTEVYGISTDTLRSDAGGPVLHGFVQLVEGSPGVLQEIGVPQLDSGPYLSYAYQWITFGGVALAAIGFFVYREITDPPEDEDGEVGYSDEPARKPRTRGFDRSELFDKASPYD